MRETKFRGKRIDNGEWVYGYYHTLDHAESRGKSFVIPSYASALYSFEVDHETVGQYTGLKDKNGNVICEGDIVTWFINDTTYTAQVYFDADQASFWMGEDIEKRCGLVLNDWMRGEYEVIGNIYEHPHLLKEVHNANNY